MAKFRLSSIGQDSNTAWVEDIPDSTGQAVGSFIEINHVPATLRKWRNFVAETLAPLSTTEELGFDWAILQALDSTIGRACASPDVVPQPSKELSSVIEEIAKLLSVRFGDWKGWLEGLCLWLGDSPHMDIRNALHLFRRHVHTVLVDMQQKN